MLGAAVTREVRHSYADPLAEIWLGAAARVGLRVRRVADAYASTDGAGEMLIAEDAALDADDSLAQMIFHELCHSLVEGEAAFAVADWGLDNTRPDDEWREHACLRVQWILAGRHGLRALLAPTTDFRALWDQFGEDVLVDRGDLSVQAAIVALGRADKPPWAPALPEALAATAQVAAAVRASLPRAPGRGAAQHELPSLWREVDASPGLHPSGLQRGQSALGGSCGACAWRFEARGVTRCRQAGGKVELAWPACERFEAALDCQTCGACCREAYHSVEVARRDPFVRKRPALVVDRGSFLEVARRGDRCAALTGGEIAITQTTRRMLPVACEVYDDRPRTCRDFTLGSEHCLTARRRVGLSL
ncbi:MAG: YkgJ family cysteine cluster protein [Myxococcales bacterium]|nr:YkgJ family cysteine cluster protein [Myxococcales bacterium]